MRYIYFIKGLLFGAFSSIITILIFSRIAQILAGGVLSFWGEKWLYYATIIPFSIGFAILGWYFYGESETSKKKLWLISLIGAFLITLSSGTIGTIWGEMVVRGGTETILINSTIMWGIIMAFILLPITTPFMRLLIGIFIKSVLRKHHDN